MSRNPLPDLTSQAYWDSRLAAEGLAPVDDQNGRVTQRPLREQQVSHEQQERYGRLAEFLREGTSHGPWYLPADASAYWLEHWRQRRPNADLAEHLAAGGFALEWQRGRGGKLKSVYRRVEVIRKLAAMLVVDTEGLALTPEQERHVDVLELFASQALGRWPRGSK